MESKIGEEKYSRNERHRDAHIIRAVAPFDIIVRNITAILDKSPCRHICTHRGRIFNINKIYRIEETLSITNTMVLEPVNE